VTSGGRSSQDKDLENDPIRGDLDKASAEIWNRCHSHYDDASSVDSLMRSVYSLREDAVMKFSDEYSSLLLLSQRNGPSGSSTDTGLGCS
jgi:hypothetical protein